jgi:pimeloyl-ACP methyl ester carboxylesterase
MLGGPQLEEELKRHQIRVIFMEDAGHGINHEKADEVNRLIVDYFSE